MALDAIKRVTEAERLNQERGLAAQAEARQMVADAERSGKALLETARAQAEARGKALLRQAEERAAARAAEIAGEAEQTCRRQRAQAERHLAETAAMIVERIVGH